MSAFEAMQVDLDVGSSGPEHTSAALLAAPLEAPARPGLRTLATEADSARGESTKLACIWLDVVGGHSVIADWFYTPSRWFVVMARPERDEPWKPVSPRVRRLFETVLLGQSQKSAAFEQGVGNSTISSTFHRALEQLGVPLTTCKVPPILMLLARAALGLPTQDARHCVLEVGGRTHEVVSTERPEMAVMPLLPRAEHEVLCRLVEGQTYAQIAYERRTSARTVANQVRSVFQRFEVSGRAELIARLLEIAARSGEHTDEKRTIPKAGRLG
jgi:DNA-binding CsgD family transcriptional regulator